MNRREDDPRKKRAFVIRWLVRAMNVADTGMATIECAEAIQHVDLMWGLMIKENDYLMQEDTQKGTTNSVGSVVKNEAEADSV